MNELTFDDVKHEYAVNGSVVPSVTQICRFYQVDVASGADPYLRDRAAEIGTKVHLETQAIDYDYVSDDDDNWEIEGYLLAYQRFLKEFDVQWEKAEYALGCNEFAGTIDRFGYVGCEMTMAILDIKTSSKINHAYVTAQLQGYKRLLVENEIISNEDEPVLLCLQLCKDGTFNLYSEKTETDLFQSALDMHNNLKNTKGTKI